ncbi:hypothetical protein BCV60_09765 [Bacillus halotolerans]|nr:hypothetical protein BCV60_09765 [Bacillus halotolerans]
MKNDNTGGIVNGGLPNGVENPYITSSDWGWAIDPTGLRYTLNRFMTDTKFRYSLLKTALARWYAGGGRQDP